MSDSGKVKDLAEKEAKEHPQQVAEGEHAIGDKLGMDSEEDQTSQHDPNSPPQGEEADHSQAS